MKGKTGLLLASLFFLILAGMLVSAHFFREQNPAGKNSVPHEDRDMRTLGKPGPEGERSTAASESGVVAAGAGRDAELAIRKIGETLMISLNELSRKTGSSLLYDELDGTVRFYFQGNQIQFLKGSPAFSVNGIFYPMEKAPVISQAEIAVPVETLAIMAGQENIQLIENRLVRIRQSEAASPAVADLPELDLAKATAGDLVRYLSFLQIPIEHARISSVDSHLPGSPRPYRNGIHEGIDWYGGFSGTRIEMMTPILASARGRVVRADLDYVEMSASERSSYLLLAQNAPRTPEWILDRLRGRQLWVQYGNGVLFRYAHLAKIADGIKPGAQVEPGDVIAYVGNSGTSNGVRKTRADAHLHLDILIYGEPFWTHLDQEGIRFVLEGIFNDQAKK